MKAQRFVPALLLACIGCTLSTQAFAYCLTTTCDPRKENCEIVDSCNVGGKTLYWSSSVVTWDVQQDGSAKEAISAQTLMTVVDGAFQAWESADCGDGTYPNIRLQPYGSGLVACSKPQYNSTKPNANVITFHDAQWPYSDGGAETNTLALTTVFFSSQTGEIYDANVELNSNQRDFVVTGGTGGQVNLDAVLTHELGHILGLSHSSDPTATMFFNYEEGMNTLEPDDVAGICASLPPNRSTTSETEPRHGFSGDCCTKDCDTTNTSCSASTIGSNASPSRTLGLWAFGLGACVWLGRGLRLRQAKRSARALRR